MIRAILAGVLLSAAVSHATVRPIAACTGGLAFDWSVAHEHGGILQGVVETVDTREDYSIDMVISDAHLVQGDPPPSLRVHAVAGAVCEQTADVGETVLLIFDIRGGEYPFALPVFYVVNGRDALDAKVVADGLRGRIPPTDTLAAAEISDDSAPAPLSIVAVAFVALLGLLMSVRRTRLR